MKSINQPITEIKLCGALVEIYLATFFTYFKVDQKE